MVWTDLITPPKFGSASSNSKESLCVTGIWRRNYLTDERQEKWTLQSVASPLNRKVWGKSCIQIGSELSSHPREKKKNERPQPYMCTKEQHSPLETFTWIHVCQECRSNRLWFCYEIYWDPHPRITLPWKHWLSMCDLNHIGYIFTSMSSLVEYPFVNSAAFSCKVGQENVCPYEIGMELMGTWPTWKLETPGKATRVRESRLYAYIIGLSACTGMSQIRPCQVASKA